MLQRRLDALLRLIDLTGRLAAEHDLDAVLAAAAELACQAVGCERASLFVYDDPSQTLVTKVATALEVHELRLPVGDGIAGWVAEHRTLVNVADPRADLRWSDVADRVTGFTTRNLLVAPLLAPPGDRLVGVLQLLNKKGGFDEFDERLLTAFASHAAIAMERAALLDESERSQALFLNLDIGRKIQTGFLPKSLPAVPGYEIAAWWEPAEGVGGDYYDVLRLPDGRVGLVIADVSGHGIGPSLLMSGVRAMLHVLARTESDPSRILSLLSETIRDDFELGRFVTLLFVALDPDRHELTWVNAGHGPSLLLDRSSGVCRMLETTAMPLGFADDHHFPTAGPLPFGPGDLLLLATDGAIELRDEADEMFGRRRLEQIFLDHQHEPAEAVRDALKTAISSVCPGNPPPDDVTLLVLERKAKG
ncbi:MAG: GAF domain-containing SpoIIE family protein phosphatase [Planctomycetaceae bacterium]